MIGHEAFQTSKSIPNHAFNGLHRSADLGCPLSMLGLATYFERTGRDDARMTFLLKAAKLNLVDAHIKIGSLSLSN
jgi:hypothetical protein